MLERLPIQPGQTGRTPRVELDLPPVDPADPPLPPMTLPEMPDPHSATGHVQPIMMLEGDDRAKSADDSVKGSDIAAAGKR